ncbi:hypothetical protein FRC06_008317 [Ceratobasidium sp. 370]|nr:hypothetical protein FRC06_008317 [Ceratobasidium sp. 370]
MPSTHQKASAYIPEHETVISHNSPTAFPQARSAATYPLGSDISEGHTPSLTWDHPSSDGLIPPVKDGHRVVDLQEEFPSVESYNEYSGPPHDYAALSPSLMDPPSPELDPQHLSGAPTSIHLQDELESSNGDYYDSGHVHMAAAMLEPSPTLQQTTQYAAKPSSKASYSDKSRVNQYFRGANIRHQASPNLAYAAPSPISKTFLPSSSHTSTPARKCNRERELDSNDESIIPAIRREPITPLQPARKYTTKPSLWLDPDEEPVWSTLPSRIKKTKQVKAPVATSRFRLPGAFLGSSSPLGEQESKRLYKPPPRKRSTERNEDRGRWKVTRIE